MTSELIKVFDDIISLHQVPDAPTTQNLTWLINEIIYEFDNNKGNNRLDLTSYINWKLPCYFQIDLFIESFKINDNKKNWFLFLDLIFDPTFDLVEKKCLIDIIIVLSKVSFKNKQDLGNFVELKTTLQNKLFSDISSVKLEDSLERSLNLLYLEILSVSCTPGDLKQLYSNFSAKHDILNELAFQTVDTLSQSHFIFHNSYKIFPVEVPSFTKSKSISLSIRLYLQLNDVLSNRILTIGKNLFLEIRENKLMLSDDECVIGLFDSLEFKQFQLYSLIINIDGHIISLYNDGQLVNKIHLFEGAISNIKTIEVGSMISNFNLYRFQVFSENVDNLIANALNKAGVIYNIRYDFDSKAFGLISAFGKSFFTEMIKTLSEEESEQSLLNFTDELILIDFDPNTELLNFKSDAYMFDTDSSSLDNSTNSYDSRPLFYYKSSNILSVFETFDCFSQIIINISECTDFDQIYELLKHLITLLNNYNLRAIFENEYGYQIINHILIHIVIPKFKKTLTLQILNLFMEFCGWNVADINDSLIKNESAYENIILDFKLWYMYSNNKELTLIGQEILRFILFQIKTLLHSSVYKSFNLKTLENLQLLRKLCHYQHLISELYPASNVLSQLQQDLISIYTSILRDNLAIWKVKHIFNFAYYELKQKYFISSEILLKALNDIITEKIENNDIAGLSIIDDSLPTKDLLMILKEIVESKENPLIGLQTILKLLVVNKYNLTNFKKRSGFKILLEILKRTEVQYYEDIIFLFICYSFDDYVYIITPPDLENFVNCSIKFQTTVSCTEFLEAAIYFSEWAVINDIRDGFVIELPKFLNSVIFQLDSLTSEKKNVSILDADTSNISKALTDLLVTVSKPQNGNIYEASGNLIQNLISKTLKYNIISLSSKDFDQYINNFLCLDPAFKKRFSLFSDHSHSYYLYVSLEKYIPGAIYELLAMDVKFSLKLLSSPSMFSNVILMYSIILKSYSEFEFTTEFYLSSFSILLICLRLYFTSDKHELESIIGLELINIIKYLLVKFQVLVADEKLDWDDEFFSQYINILLRYSDILFENQYEIINSNVTWLIFIFICYCMNSQAISLENLRIFRHILTGSKTNQDYILEKLEFKGRKDIHSVINQFISFHDEEAILLLKKNNDRICTMAQFQKFRLSSLEQLQINDYKNYISSKEVSSGIFKKKQEKMDLNLTDKEKLYKIFKTSVVEKEAIIMRSGDKEIKSFNTDREEDLVINRNRCKQITFRNLLTDNFQDNSFSLIEWSLDDIEDFQKSRRKLISIQKYEQTHNTKQTELEPFKENNENILNGSTHNDSLLSYEVISTISVEDEYDFKTTEENRKVLKILRPSDSIKEIWNCSRIVGLEIKEGILILGQTHLYFIHNYFFSQTHKNIINLSKVPSDNRDVNLELIGGSSKIDVTEEHDLEIWENINLKHVTKRPFLLRDVAFELFFSGGQNSLFTFRNKYTRDTVYSELSKITSSMNMDPLLKLVLDEINKRSSGVGLKNGMSRLNLRNKVFNVLNTSTFDGFEATEQWVNGEISNFYYLMILNMLAGRSYNDLTQYPVFPWIISDYSSKTISLDDKNIYRDLTKPMGAQSEKRASQFKERYCSLESLEDPLSPPFHYGTHYSSSMIVSSYLIRLRPFVDSYLLLQSGKFGPADRLFNSIERAWSSASNESTTDVRELIPEFFCLPEFLTNINGFEFGKDQNDKAVNDVKLPTWANNDPTIFVWKNREALESEYVSENLHHWIDLIFGYKQKGTDAIASLNVFNKVSYPGAVQLDEIDNIDEKRAIVGMIHNFGQTPLQIFSTPHPKRAIKKSFSLTNSIFKLNELPSQTIDPPTSSKNFPTKYIRYNHGFNNSIKWQSFPVSHVPIHHRLDASLDPKSSAGVIIGKKLLGRLHNVRITEICGASETLLFTGDETGLIKIWNCTPADYYSISYVGALRGHENKIDEIKFYSEYNIVISLDESGLVLLWDLKTCHIIRSINKRSIKVAISQGNGDIALVSKDNKIYMYNINGSCYCDIDFKNHTITAIQFFNISSLKTGKLRHAFWKERNVILLGFDDGVIEIYEFLLSAAGSWSLNLLKVIATGAKIPITSIKPHLKSNFIGSYEDDDFIQIIAGDENGILYIW